MGACCCSDEKKSAIVDLAAPTTEEHSAAYGYATGEGDGEVAEWPAQERAASPASAGQKDEASEKARLTGLVGEFAKQAVVGYHCMTFDEMSGEQSECVYWLHSNLELLTVSPNMESEEVLKNIPVASIRDIYSHCGDGPAPFPQPVLAALSPAERFLLVMVVFEGAKGTEKFTFQEQSPQALQTFLECMRVLVVYARARLEGQ